MGLNKVPEEMLFYGALTVEEKGRIQPCTRAKCVMRTGNSPPPSQPSIPSGYDIPDDASITGKAPNIPTAIPTSVKPRYPDGEDDIEEVVPIVDNDLPTVESQPKNEKNGIDRKLIDEKLVHDPDDDPCIVKCVYFAQQCCECTIL